MLCNAILARMTMQFTCSGTIGRRHAATCTCTRARIAVVTYAPACSCFGAAGGMYVTYLVGGVMLITLIQLVDARSQFIDRLTGSNSRTQPHDANGAQMVAFGGMLLLSLCRLSLSLM